MTPRARRPLQCAGPNQSLLAPPRRGNDRTITSHTLDDFRASLQQQSQQRGKENKIRPAGPKLWNSSANWEE